MYTFPSHELDIVLNRQGSGRYRKSSHPVRYGVTTEVRAGDFVLHYNRKGQVKTIAGRGDSWPHPAEWLKRTPGNHWVYYSTGSYYNGVVDLFGEYYLPCPEYPTNTLFKEDPFQKPVIREALKQAAVLPGVFSEIVAGNGSAGMGADLRLFLEKAERQTKGRLDEEARRLHDILAAPVTVLPPDCRHVDYDVIPLIITEGCLYNCDFCRVKSQSPFSQRSQQDIERQLYGLKDFFGEDLVNYNSLFLGQHDALAADQENLLFAARRAYEILDIGASIMAGPRLFLFGSVDSFLVKNDEFFDALNRLPWYVHINLGLESFDPDTLTRLGKPVPATMVEEAFLRSVELNRKLVNVEFSANFVIGNDLPDSHQQSLLTGLADRSVPFTSRTTIYISPLSDSGSAHLLLSRFREIKRKNRFDTYLYLIQRL